MISRFVTYYINLDESNERRLAIEGQLKCADLIESIRVSAVDGRGADLTAEADYDDKAAVSSVGRSLTGGEYGCYKSHIKTLELFLARDDDFAVVIEDDVILDPGWTETLRSALDVIAAVDVEFDVMHLAADRLKFFTSISCLPGGQDVVAAHYFPMTTSALLWSRGGAKKFLMDNTTVEMPIDHKLREVIVRSGKGLAVWPSIARQSGKGSDIDDVSDKRGYATRRWFYGFVKQRRLFLNKSIAIMKLIEFRLSKRNG